MTAYSGHQGPGRTNRLILERLTSLDLSNLRIEAPRLRQRIYQPGFGFGAPVWVDDASFHISRHVRTRPVPAGGGEDTLLATCVALNDQPFDQAHPRWEVWLLTGPLNGQVSMLIPIPPRSRRRHRRIAAARHPVRPRA
jgi:hypothetical protein